MCGSRWAARSATRGPPGCWLRPAPRSPPRSTATSPPPARPGRGGRERTPWPARLLAEAGPEVAAAINGQLAAAGAARVWVAAERPRELVFVPGVDVRGLRDLPVLIVAGEDLAGAVGAVAEGRSEEHTAELQ